MTIFDLLVGPIPHRSDEFRRDGQIGYDGIGQFLNFCAQSVVGVIFDSLRNQSALVGMGILDRRATGLPNTLVQIIFQPKCPTGFLSTFLLLAAVRDARESGVTVSACLRLGAARLRTGRLEAGITAKRFHTILVGIAAEGSFPKRWGDENDNNADRNSTEDFLY